MIRMRQHCYFWGIPLNEEMLHETNVLAASPQKIS